MEEVVCLGCGLTVDGPPGDRCVCPPPSIRPRSSAHAAAGPYRAPPPAAACPRCAGRLVELALHDASVLDCTACRGLFVPREVIEELGRPHGKRLRLAFPRRERVEEAVPVRYLRCPACQAIMNRTNFGRASGVIVDVCADHGVWFDCGEVDAVIRFVESGALDESERAHAAARDAENAQLRTQWRREHDAGQAATVMGRRHVQPTPGERLLVDTFVSWLRW